MVSISVVFYLKLYSPVYKCNSNINMQLKKLLSFFLFFIVVVVFSQSYKQNMNNPSKLHKLKPTKEIIYKQIQSSISNSIANNFYDFLQKQN